MKKNILREAFLPRAALVLAKISSLMLAVCSLCLACRGQGTAIGYQGWLSTSNGAANGSYDLVFALYDTNLGGNLVGGPITNLAVTVSNGLIQTTMDFGGVFTGADRWLEISVRTNGATGFTALTPRQKLTPTPYAIYAETASGLAAGAALSGNGAGLTNIPAAGVTGLGTAAVTGTNTIVSMAAATYGISQGISSLALESANPGYHDGWLDCPIGYNTWFSIGAGINQYFITNNVLPRFMGLTGSADMRKILAPKIPYLLIDEGMFLGFDSNGIPTVDPGQFPNGFPWLANYIHTNGFAVGIWMQAYGGDFNTQMTNYNAPVFANYLITNHVDYVKFDGVLDPSDADFPYSDFNTNAVVLFTYLRAAPYPIYINSALGNGTNLAESRAMSLLDSFRSTAVVGYDSAGNVVIGDLNPIGQRPLRQDQWVDAALALRPYLGNGLTPDFDPLGARNWADAKRHISLCTFFSSSFQWGELGGDVFAGFENVWSNVLSVTSIKIRRDQFAPYKAYTTNGVDFIVKQNTDGGIDLLLLNRNYQVSVAPTNLPPDYAYGISYGPGYQMDLFTNYYQNFPTNLQYVFWATNVTVDFTALGLSGGAYTCYNAASDGRLTVTNNFNIVVPPASAQLFRIVPPVAEPPYRYLSLEKWFEYTNYAKFPDYPYRNTFEGNPTVQLIGSSQIYSNGIVQFEGSKATYGVNGARMFSATFGPMASTPSFVDNVTIFLDTTPVAYFNTGTLTNFSCVIPPGTKTISFQADSTGEPFCMVNPLLSSQADGSYLTGLTAADGSAVVGQSSLTASNFLSGTQFTNGATANGQIPYSTNTGKGWFWAAPNYDPAGAAQQATNHLPVLWTTNVVTAINAGTGIAVSASTNAGGIVYTVGVPGGGSLRAPAPVTLGASPFSFTNTSGGYLECYFNGGGGLGISKNGVRVFTNTPCYLVLQPVSRVAVTYSIAPTFQTNQW